MSQAHADFINICKKLVIELEDIDPCPRTYMKHREEKIVEDNPLDRSWTKGPYEMNPIELTKILTVFDLPFKDNYLAIQVYADRYEGKVDKVIIQPFQSGRCPTCYSGEGTLRPADHFFFSLDDFKKFLYREV